MRFLKITILSGVPFGFAMGLVYSMGSGLKTGMIYGALAGVFFGLIMAAFAEFQHRRMSQKGSDLEGENLIHQGPANHFLNAEGRGGFLYLTESRLLFRAHKFNIQSSEVSIPLSNITKVEPTRSLGIIPNGIIIHHGDGQKERFVAMGRKKWLEVLRKKVA